MRIFTKSPSSNKNRKGSPWPAKIFNCKVNVSLYEKQEYTDYLEYWLISLFFVKYIFKISLRENTFTLNQGCPNYSPENNCDPENYFSDVRLVSENTVLMTQLVWIKTGWHPNFSVHLVTAWILFSRWSVVTQSWTSGRNQLGGTNPLIIWRKSR